ncbi:hypothetical protein EVAR_19804_1 [Eumeta japonica]|uniref:Uncharacterized protein n=1 Tax=Eumeta variegata TaxID=151549 RepID=A0A4C1US08_EUMVA|nr:hypothetical protein EVAR_19804_1 [Eumeta japonica]
MSGPSSCRRDSCSRISELADDRHTRAAQLARPHSPLHRPTQPRRSPDGARLGISTARASLRPQDTYRQTTSVAGPMTRKDCAPCEKKPRSES